MAGCGPLARGLDRVGELSMFLGGGLVLMALGAASGGVLLTGIAMGMGGLVMRTAGYAVAAHEIEHRGVRGPEPRPGRDGRVPQNEHEAVQMFEEEVADEKPHFASMLEERRKTAVQVPGGSPLREFDGH